MGAASSMAAASACDEMLDLRSAVRVVGARGAPARAEGTLVHRVEGLTLGGVAGNGGLGLSPGGIGPHAGLHANRPACHGAVDNGCSLDLQSSSIYAYHCMVGCKLYPGRFHVPDDNADVDTSGSADARAKPQSLPHSRRVILPILNAQRLISEREGAIFASYGTAQQRFPLQLVVLGLAAGMSKW
ncbi:hypothetical protein NUW54_g10356 [Trametes sanguinea]|uniref:Uncharacterized protein n=1 Tax=Trametes sanguinea TaxID=158606 RepID=A0ACC1NZM4_9APHY|nr:hypothetical protein NUW54_g10356 [Trametes sanguinea]